MNKEKISFVMPSRNTLEFLKMAYNSIRDNNDNKHEIILLDDNSNDGTWKWLQEINKEDDNVIIYKNDTGNRVGHTILYDKGVELATNDLVLICHSDMYYGKGFVDNLLKHYDKKKVISATRIEPPLHPPGPEKIIADFGKFINEFKPKKLNKFIQKKQNQFKDEITKGIFAPWLISKEDFNDIGGHDPLFRPQSREDSDIFNRFILNGYELLQSRDSFIYHFTCRGSRFKDKVGKNSNEWKKTNYKGERNFIRKWGSMVNHDDNMLPIINNKYQIRLVIDCRDGIDKESFEELLTISEPRVKELVIFDPNRIYFDKVNKYKQEEQKITDIDLDNKIVYYDDEITENTDSMDVEIFTQPRILSKDNGAFIQLIHKLLDNIEEEGQYDYDGNKIVVKNLKRDYYKDNIFCDKNLNDYLK